MTKTVVVTGAGGYIAAKLIKVLLNKGYQVRATVRNVSKVKEKYGFLVELDPEGKQLQFFEADLLKNGSFDKAMQGVDGVFHCASPFQIGIEDPANTLIKPALEGTTNVLTAALKEKTCKRIIVTSSVAAVRNTLKKSDEVYDENDWNSTATLEREPYPLSKYLAEKKAWEMINDTNINKYGATMCTINPSFVMGPPISTRVDSTSVKMIKQLAESAYQNGIPKLAFGCVDVDDVVQGHVLAFENEKATGRFVLSSHEPVPTPLLGKWVSEALPQLKVSLKEAEGKYSSPILFSTKKAEKELGLKMSPVEDAVKRMAKYMLEKGMIAKM